MKDIKIKENGGLVDKKASEDKFTNFDSSMVELFLYSLILSYFFTLRVFLEHSSFGARKEKQAKEGRGKERKARKSRIKQLQQDYLQVTYCMCDFLAGFDMHGFACWYLVLWLLVAWSCWVMTMVFSLAFPFSG